MFGQQIELAVLMFDEHRHESARSLTLFPYLAVKLLLGRQGRYCGLELLIGYESWQNLLYRRESAIEVFEESIEHGVVHRPHLQQHDGGKRTAILASSG